jgi:acyl transferase domain-containing protein
MLLFALIGCLLDPSGMGVEENDGARDTGFAVGSGDDAEEFLADYPDVSVAVEASPRQIVIAGPPDQVDAVIAVVAAYVVWGERLSLLGMAGAALVIAGILVSAVGESRRHVASRRPPTTL